MKRLERIETKLDVLLSHAGLAAKAPPPLASFGTPPPPPPPPPPMEPPPDLGPPLNV